VSDPGNILKVAAAYETSVSTIDLLVQPGARVDKSFTLHVAATRENSIALMEHLVELGADVNEYEFNLYWYVEE
jgi:hypothetical protein